MNAMSASLSILNIHLRLRYHGLKERVRLKDEKLVRNINEIWHLRDVVVIGCFGPEYGTIIVLI